MHHGSADRWLRPRPGARRYVAIAALGVLFGAPIGCTDPAPAPPFVEARSSADGAACRAESLDAYAAEVAWHAARDLEGPAPVTRTTVAREDIPPLRGTEADPLDYRLGPEGLFADERSVGGTQLDPTSLVDALATTGPSARAWRLTIDPDTPARDVASVLLAFRRRGTPHGSLVVATPVLPPAAEIDVELFRRLVDVDDLFDLAARVRSTFSCAALDTAVGEILRGPKRIDDVGRALSAAMVRCGCRPSVASYRSLMRRLSTGRRRLDQVGVATPVTIDLSATALQAAAGATWADVFAPTDTAEPWRGWVSAPDAEIPPAWRVEAARHCRESLGEACTLACELGDEASCTAAEIVSAAAVRPAMQACAETWPLQWVPAPPPPFQFDEALVLASPPPPQPGPTPVTVISPRADREARLRQLGIGPRCEADAWTEKQKAAPDDESLYCVLSLVHEQCEQPQEAMRWAVDRTRAFPRRPGAWLGLAGRYYAQYAANPNADADTLAAIGDAMVQATARALALDAKSSLVHGWAAAGYDIRGRSRAPSDPLSTAAEHRARYEALADHLASWRHASRACPPSSDPRCPSIAPFSADEVRAIDAITAKLYPDRARP